MTSITPDLLQQLALRVEERLGLHFPPDRHRDLARGVSAAARQSGWEDGASFAAFLLEQGGEALDLLAPHLTIGESYFFREPRMLDTLRECVIPGILEHNRAHRHRKRSLRIWSAGCSSGEEPYTIAILLDELLPQGERWTVEIVATDVNPTVLEKGRKGVYREWSFRNVPSWLKQRHFTKLGENQYEIEDRLKDMVEFRHLNLAGGDYPSSATGTEDVDLILCRNVLIYFSAQAMGGVLRRFRRCLGEAGWLVTGPSEASHVFAEDVFHPVTCGNTLLFAVGDYRSAGEARWNREPQPGMAPPASPAAPPYTTMEADSGPTESGEQGGVSVAPPRPATDAAAPSQATALERARSLANLGRLEEALAESSAAVEADALNPDLRYLQAEILLELGRRQEAARALERVVYLDPGAAMARYHLGVLAAAEGDHVMAHKHYARALRALGAYADGDDVPGAGGMNAARLREIVESAMQ